MRQVLDLSHATFRLLQEFVYDNSGIRLGIDQISHLERKLTPVCQRQGLNSFEDLYSFAKHHPRGRQALDAIIEALTTHETYLYREPLQFELLIEEILKPKRIEQARIRILSAGCSSGEELVSILLLLEEQGLLEDQAIDFVGVDISSEIVEKARSGIYRESAFRAAPLHWMQRYFSPTEDGHWKLDENLHRRLQFSQLNLLDSFRFRLLGEFDIIFCRNVMIYFDTASKTELVENFYRRMRPSGYLFLGHAENLMQIESAFVPQQFIRDVVYQKVDDNEGAGL